MNDNCTLETGPCGCGAWHSQEEIDCLTKEAAANVVSFKSKTNYKPVTVTLDGITLPFQLRNNQGDVLASIEYWTDFRKGFHSQVNGHRITEYGFETLTECIDATFAYLYKEMNYYRKIAEKHQKLVSALKESL